MDEKHINYDRQQYPEFLEDFLYSVKKQAFGKDAHEVIHNIKEWCNEAITTAASKRLHASQEKLDEIEDQFKKLQKEHAKLVFTLYKDRVPTHLADILHS